MDDEETIGMAFGTLAGEFLRTRVVPELDAYRFATMAATAGILSATPADVVPGTTPVASAIYNAEAALGDAEVPEEGRILFISENAYHGLRADGQIQRMWQNEGDLRTEIEVFDGMRVVRVPKARFCTGITLYDGSTAGQEDGGYEFSSGTSYPINFMIVHPTAVLQVVKHALPRIFDPNTNQAANAWKFDYRLYHDLFVEDNKVQGIYLHRAATALAADING